MVGPFASFKWEALFSDWTVFAEGFAVTLFVAVSALVLAMILGVVFGVMASSHVTALKRISRVYVEVIQNTPLVIQIFFLYHGLPHMGMMLDVIAVGVLGVGVYHGAYISEVVRAGIEAVPKGQVEAAYSQGFTYVQAMQHVVLPQARRMAYPPLTNQAVSLIKNTSVMAMIAGGDLMYHADSWSSNNLYYGPAYVVTGLLYIALCYPLARYARHLERKMEVAL